MKTVLMSALRDQGASVEQFRMASDQLGLLLAIESGAKLIKAEETIKTPFGFAKGEKLAQEVVLVPILRSGLVLLPPFLKFYPSSLIGFIGMKRDEETAIPKLYYENLPAITSKQTLFLLDPMIATGGSSCLAVKRLIEAGALEENITLVSFIASPEGIARFKQEAKKANLIVAQIDEGLNSKKFIIPGLGDFGDRYFTHEGK